MQDFIAQKAAETSMKITLGTSVSVSIANAANFINDYAIVIGVTIAMLSLIMQGIFYTISYRLEVKKSDIENREKQIRLEKATLKKARLSKNG